MLCRSSYIVSCLGDIIIKSSSADIEGILSVEPDLIIMSPRQEKIYDQLAEIAPTVIINDNANDWEAKFKEVAKLFDQEDEAQNWLDNYYKKALFPLGYKLD